MEMYQKFNATGAERFKVRFPREECSVTEMHSKTGEFAEIEGITGLNQKRCETWRDCEPENGWNAHEIAAASDKISSI